MSCPGPAGFRPPLPAPPKPPRDDSEAASRPARQPHGFLGCACHQQGSSGTIDSDGLVLSVRHLVERLVRRIEDVHLAYTSGQPKDGEYLRLAVLRAMKEVCALRGSDYGHIWLQYVDHVSGVPPLLVTWFATPCRAPDGRQIIRLAITPNDTLASIVVRLGHAATQLVAELNGHDVPHERWPFVKLRATDRLVLHPRKPSLVQRDA